MKRRRAILAIGAVLLFNFFLIFFCVKDGIKHDDLMLRFNERQTVTFFSALLLGFTSITSLTIYLLKKHTTVFSENRRFWFFSGLGFFYLAMDEYFMAHEGLDEFIGSWFGRDIKALNLDNLIIAFYGLLALFICFRFRREIFLYPEMVVFSALASLGLLGTIIFHSFERIGPVMEVIEESSKIVGVSLFFAAYWLVLLSTIKAIPEAPKA